MTIVLLLCALLVCLSPLSLLWGDRALLPKSVVLPLALPSPRGHQRSFIEVRGLVKVYESWDPEKRVVALRGVDVDISANGVTGILGPSGQGKTTFLNLIGGLDRPTQGTICFDGEEIPFWNESRMRLFRAYRVAWVFQDLNLIGHLTVEENVALPLLCRGFCSCVACPIARQRIFVARSVAPEW